MRECNNTSTSLPPCTDLFPEFDFSVHVQYNTHTRVRPRNTYHVNEVWWRGPYLNH